MHTSTRRSIRSGIYDGVFESFGFGFVLRQAWLAFRLLYNDTLTAGSIGTWCLIWLGFPSSDSVYAHALFCLYEGFDGNIRARKEKVDTYSRFSEEE